MKPSTETRTLLIHRIRVARGPATDKYDRITIPANTRITHGPFSPAKGGGDMERCMRIYLGTQQIACLPGVQDFYDETLIKVEESVDPKFKEFARAITEET